MIIVLGFTTRGSNEAPVVIYCGNRGSEAAAAVEASTFPRIERINHPQTFPVRGWSQERAEAHAAAVAEAEGSQKLDAEAQEFVLGRFEAQKQELEQLRAAFAEQEQEKLKLQLEVAALGKELAELKEKLAKAETISTTPLQADIAPAQPAVSQEAPAATVADDGPSLLPVEDPPARKRR